MDIAQTIGALLFVDTLLSMDIDQLTLPPPADIDEPGVKAAIDAIDFSLVRLKLTHPQGGLGWTEAEAEKGEEWYKKFLFLLVKYPTAKLAVNRLIDEFWHQHILDTKAYAADCQSVFGEFYHHWPYAGLLGEQNNREWMENARITLELFRIEFGTAGYEVI